MKTTYLNENSQVEKSSNCARGGTSAALWPKLLVYVSSLTVNACTSIILSVVTGRPFLRSEVRGWGGGEGGGGSVR